MFVIGAFTGEFWNCIPMSPNPSVLTCASPPASTLAHRVSPLPEPPPLAPTPTTTPQCDWPPTSTAAGPGPGSVTGSAATGGSTAAGTATGAAALPTGGKTLADATAS